MWQFALEVKAGLTGLVTPVVVRLDGRGKANAQRSVLVHIGSLAGSGNAKARVELDPRQRKKSHTYLPSFPDY